MEQAYFVTTPCLFTGIAEGRSFTGISLIAPERGLASSPTNRGRAAAWYIELSRHSSHSLSFFFTTTIKMSFCSGFRTLFSCFGSNSNNNNSNKGLASPLKIVSSRSLALDFTNLLTHITRAALGALRTKRRETPTSRCVPL